MGHLEVQSIVIF